MDKQEHKKFAHIILTVTEHIVKMPEKPKYIKIDFDTEGYDLQADCGDLIFVYARVTDKNGTLIPEYDEEVVFTVKGDCTIIGPDKVEAEAGITTILLQAGACNDNKTITVAAKTLYKERLLENEKSIKVAE